MQSLPEVIPFRAESSSNVTGEHQILYKSPSHSRTVSHPTFSFLSGTSQPPLIEEAQHYTRGLAAGFEVVVLRAFQCHPWLRSGLWIAQER